jgi:XTP/dITP diphosphohydrolase
MRDWSNSLRFSAPPWASNYAPGDTLIVATRSRHKLEEFQRILGDSGWKFLSMDQVGFNDAIDEPFDTYEENATQKAKLVSDALGRAVIADDSGLEVSGLNGWPGVHSARWKGADATDADRLEGVIALVSRLPDAARQARYIAAVALAVPGYNVIVVTQTTEGEIVDPAGEHGFGYDPAFFSPELGKTFAQATGAEKDRVSHRGRALRELGRRHLGI